VVNCRTGDTLGDAVAKSRPRKRKALRKSAVADDGRRLQPLIFSHHYAAADEDRLPGEKFRRW
jgi:hypothetical protein